MTRRIFRSIFAVALCVFFSSVILFMSVLYGYFSDMGANQLKTQTELAAKAVDDEGIEYLKNLSLQNIRITWINSNGSVLYDSDSNIDKMENHLEREEVKEALSSGYGESSRYSVTLLERSLYSAKRLSDNSVIRLSVSQNTLLTLMLGMFQPICIIFVIAIILSFVLASRLSKRVVKPLNELNLDKPTENEVYEELSPLLNRINIQQQQIKHQRDELSQKCEEFDAITENMSEGILLLNAEGNVIGINRAAQRLFKTDKSCIGKHILSVNRSSEISKLLSDSEKGKRTEKVIDIAGGKYQLNSGPVISDGKVSGTVLLALDVTDKENAERIRKEFTANVSHELKTPLHTIAGSAELLSNGVVKAEDLPYFYSRIQSEAQRMINLVEDIIRLSHLDEGVGNIKREETDLYVLAKETIKTLSEEAYKAGVSIAISGETAVINGIPQMLESIVYNLCDNAVKYNRAGGSVSVTIENKKECVVLTVSDTGIGIPTECRERIFERFYRVDKSRSKEMGGTGLGLSIVKHAARLHNASIELQSTVDKGTEISVTFPKDES